MSTAPGLSFWVTVAFTLNYSLGSGFLTLPWAFSQTGTVLGILVLAVFGFYSMLATFFLLETIDRGRKVLQLTDNFGHLSTQVHHKVNYVSIGNTSSHSGAEGEKDTRMPQSNESLSTSMEITFSDPEMTFADPDDFAINRGTRKLEINELCEMFLGKKGKLLFTLLIVVYMTGTLWAYGTVFANAFAAHLNIGSYSYYIYLLLFSFVVIPASTLEFSEQVSVQVALSVFRVVMVFLMVLTTWLASSNGSNDFNLDHSQDTASTSTWNKMEWYNLYFLLPVAAYSYIFHHSVPSLEYPVRNKRSLVLLFATAITIAMILYMIVGAGVSAYFNEHIDQSSNLNWVNYSGPYGNHWLGKIISFFVVVFPAFDVASAFPLNAYTLGNTLMTTIYGEEIESHSHAGSHLRTKLIYCRAIAAGLPLFGALIDHNLGHITDYTGLAAFVLAFIFPPILAYASEKKLATLGVNHTSMHSSILTKPFFQNLLLVSGIVALLFAGQALIESDMA